MHIAALANSTDESLTMLINGLAYARTSGSSVISAPPLTLYRSRFSANTCRAKGGVEKLISPIPQLEKLVAIRSFGSA